MRRARKEPCPSCPYRRDVPGGVWAADEYLKLAEYDKPTGDQPLGVFHCHTSPDWICTGWLACHTRHNRRGHELLSIRIADSRAGAPVQIPSPATPLFASGAEAAAHGLKGIAKPSRAARAMIARLLGIRARKRRR